MNGAVLMATRGSYSDTETWPVAAFADVELAAAHKLELEKELARAREAVVIMRDGDTYDVDVTDVGLRIEGKDVDYETSLPGLGFAGVVNVFGYGGSDLTLFVVQMPIRGFGGAP